jgi:hypothetical protein
MTPADFDSKDPAPVEPVDFSAFSPERVARSREQLAAGDWFEPQMLDEIDNPRADLERMQEELLDAALMPPSLRVQNTLPPMKEASAALPADFCGCSECVAYSERQLAGKWSASPDSRLQPGEWAELQRCDACDSPFMFPGAEGVCSQCREAFGRFGGEKEPFMQQPEWVGWLVLVLAALAFVGGIWLWWHLVSAAEGL